LNLSYIWGPWKVPLYSDEETQKPL